VTVQLWPEVFCRVRSAARWPAPSLSGTTFQVPAGISVVVQREPVEWAAEDADVEGAPLVAGAEDVEVDDDAAEPVSEPGPDEEVAAAGLVPPAVGPPAPALVCVLLEQPAASAPTPSAPAATRTEIRFMRPNLPG
jgi:hypothetical protein